MHQVLKLGAIVSLAALALLAVPSSAGASAIRAPAPASAHWWQAEGNANDTAGTGARPDNGRLVGAGFGPGVSGTDQAFSFAGGGQRVMFNKTGGNRGNGDFTFSFDIKTTATGQQGTWEKRIACDTNGTPFWGFRVNPVGPPAGTIVFELGTPPRNSYFTTSTTAVNDGAWHQVTVTRQGRTVNLYIDGTLEATTTTRTTVSVSNKARMRAGVSTCDRVDSTRSFTGELDELMIFRSALTQPQIQAFGKPVG